ncbi:MAG: bifunctional anthranilate synthase component II/anthranilate phosphoribosyltransferase [Deltaproteobacteria bacterium]|nr:bifunctional anthranilate synthase component II/anthranilate phosphoribosyltransferase [Deltaproteobacteria bacterium]
MLLLIDNYDSFVYNLAHYFTEEGQEVRVVRNDAITLDEVEAMAPDYIVVSPGPCTPAEAGVSIDLIRRFAGKVPILGVCLGHQAIGAAFGGKIIRAPRTVHGKTTDINHDRHGIFSGINTPLTVGRYHSLVIDPETLPDTLVVTATAPSGEIMAVRHKEFDVQGVQFHPESILTDFGHRMCRNFLHGGGVKRMNIREGIVKAVANENLSGDEAADVMEEIMSGRATEAQIGAYLIAMRQKGETAEEIASCAATMRRFATPLPAPEGVVLDTCGTGGDNLHTLNVSTIAALITAGAGLPVAKHGNRSITSKCGSADLLEAAGVNIVCSPKVMGQALQDASFGFAFAPIYHGAMKYAIGPRRQIGVRTLFNMLGPLTNPAGARHQLLGVFDGKLTRFFAEVLGLMGSKHAMIVHGEDGMDEITLTGKTHVAELKNGEVTEYDIAPEDFGLTRCALADLAGGTPEENVLITRRILDGEEQGPMRDIVLLNAGAALYVGGKADDIAQGVRFAAESIDSGAARMSFDKLIEVTRG